MARVRRIKKAYKIYGTDEGNVLLKLFYTYYTVTDTLEKYDRGKTQSDYRTAFTQYVRQKYGDEVCDEYWSFYRANNDNKKLIKVLDKKKNEYLIRDMMELALKINNRKQPDLIDHRKDPGEKSEKKKDKPKEKDKSIKENTNIQGFISWTGPDNDQRAKTQSVIIPQYKDRIAHKITRYDGKCIEADDVYKYKTAMDSIMMTNYWNRDEVVFYCPVCSKKVRTIIKLEHEGKRLVYKSICPSCKAKVKIVE